MTYIDNPAGRLRYWLERAQQSGADGAALVHAWADLLEMDRDTPETIAAILRHAAALSGLCAEVRTEASRLPEYLHPDLLLVDFHQVESAVALFLKAHQVTLGSLLTTIQPTGHRGLELLDTYLHTHRPQPHLDADVREGILGQVQKLSNDIHLADDLDDEVKDFVQARLAEVERALLEATLTGTPAIERATDALIGAMHRRPDLWERIAETRWAQRLGKLAGALCLALSSAGGLPALLPGDEPRPDVITNVQIEDAPFTDDSITITINDIDDDVVDAEVVDEKLQSRFGQDE